MNDKKKNDLNWLIRAREREKNLHQTAAWMVKLFNNVRHISNLKCIMQKYMRDIAHIIVCHLSS